MEQKTNENLLELPILGPKTIGESSAREHLFPALESSSIKHQLEYERTILAALFASTFSMSEQEFKDSLPEDPLEIKEYMKGMAPLIVLPNIPPETIAEKTGFDIKHNPSDVANWPDEGEPKPSEPHIVWVTIDKSRTLPQAIDEYKDHDFFRGATLTEGIFAAIHFAHMLEDTETIFTPGSRIEKIFVPSISQNSKRKIEIGNPVLPSDDPAPLRGVLIAAR